jgi:hypothetical protein
MTDEEVVHPPTGKVLLLGSPFIEPAYIYSKVLSDQSNRERA